MNDTLIAYISEGGNVKETRTFLLRNNNAKKDLLFLLHQIANGLPTGTRITFSTEV